MEKRKKGIIHPFDLVAILLIIAALALLTYYESNPVYVKDDNNFDSSQIQPFEHQGDIEWWENKN